MRWLQSLPILCASLLSGCSLEPAHEPRHFPNAEQSLAHWRRHESEFRQLVVEWRRSGGREFSPHEDSWWWDATHAHKTWWGPWRVTRPAAGSLSASDGYFSSQEEAARFAGIPGPVLLSLLRHAENLQLRSLGEVVTPAGRTCTRLDLKGGWMGLPNGFLNCPGATEELHTEQVHGSWLCPAWMQVPASDYKVVDKDWAYFEMPAREPQ